MGPKQFWFSIDPKVFTPSMLIPFKTALRELKKKTLYFCVASLSLHGILTILVTVGLILALIFYTPEDFLMIAKVISSAIFAVRLAGFSFEAKSYYHLFCDEKPKSARLFQTLSVSINILCLLVESSLLVWFCLSRFQMDLTWVGIVVFVCVGVLFLILTANILVIQATYELESWFKKEKSMHPWQMAQ